MTEGLSPQTITLVIIIRLYIFSPLPESKYLSTFLAKFLEGFPLVDDKEDLFNPTLLSLCETIEQTCHNNWKRKSIEQRDQLTRSIQFKLLSIIWSIDSVDRLLSVVHETYDIVTKRLTITYDDSRTISHRSLFGRFAQRLAVSMKLLHFDESSLLFVSFCQYRQTTLERFKDMEMQIEEKHKVLDTTSSMPLGTKPVLLDSRGDRSTSSCFGDETFYKTLNSCLESIATTKPWGKGSMAKTLTVPYMESLVEKQISVLQRYGTSTPRSLKSIFTLMASLGFMSENSGGSYPGELSSIHYLTYLESLHSGDYRGAFDSLHRYFDYMVSKGSRYFYHFALISKAALHQFFGENEKALDSIEEAISVARENKDNSTLTYILSWLFDFVRKNPSLWDNQSFSRIKNDSQLLDSLVRKSQSVSLSLAAISYRFESEYLMNCNACFSKYFESLFKSNYLSMNDHVTSFIGACHATSKLWELVGVFHLADLYINMGLDYSEQHGTAFDAMDFKLRKRRRDSSPSGFEQSLISDYKADPSRYRSMHHKLLFHSAEKSMKEGCIHLAAEILSALPAFEELDQDSRMERMRLDAMIESANGNFAEALSVLDRQIIDPSTQSRPLQSQLTCLLKLNLVKSQVLIQSGVPLRAVSLILQQMEVAKLSGFSPFLLEGWCSLIKVFRKAGRIINAYTLALSLISQAFCLDDSSSISTIFYELSYLCLLLLKRSEDELQIDKKELFRQCLSFLSVSISGFKRIGNLRGLSKCFDLESQISMDSFSPEDKYNTDLLAEFCEHSKKGLQILEKRTNEQRGHGYLLRISK